LIELDKTGYLNKISATIFFSFANIFVILNPKYVIFLGGCLYSCIGTDFKPQAWKFSFEKTVLHEKREFKLFSSPKLVHGKLQYWQIGYI
jgi:hypothetical protein